jgi:hypothetical protein
MLACDRLCYNRLPLCRRRARAVAPDSPAHGAGGAWGRNPPSARGGAAVQSGATQAIPQAQRLPRCAVLEGVRGMTWRLRSILGGEGGPRGWPPPPWLGQRPRRTPGKRRRRFSDVAPRGQGGAPHLRHFRIDRRAPRGRYSSTGALAGHDSKRVWPTARPAAPPTCRRHRASGCRRLRSPRGAPATHRPRRRCADQPASRSCSAIGSWAATRNACRAGPPPVARGRDLNLRAVPPR